MLYISHKLEEIRALCEAATVLRGGRVVATCDPREETARSLAQMMIGGELATPARGGEEAGNERLAVRNLSLEPDHPFGTPIRNVSLAVRAGEILGIAGVAGNGQPELLAASERGDAVPPGRLDPARRPAGRPAGSRGPAARAVSASSRKSVSARARCPR